MSILEQALSKVRRCWLCNKQRLRLRLSPFLIKVQFLRCLTIDPHNIILTN